MNKSYKMSSQTETSSTQPNIRHIPIFVEGRDEPIINKNIETGAPAPGTREPNPNNNNAGANTQSKGNIFNQHHHRPEPSAFEKQFQSRAGRESSPDTGGIDFPKMSQFSHLVKDFPVRNLGSSFFRSESPNRAASPGRQVPVFHTTASANASAQHKTSPPPQQPQQQYSQPQFTQQQHQPSPPRKSSSQNSNTENVTAAVDEPDNVIKSSAVPPPQPPIDSITKIQNIQRDVLDLMDKVEQFQGSSRRDKYYLYLDEMLTQNLLKLDTIDTEGKDNIKLARREAIKCINHCISVLEAKAEAGAVALAAGIGAGTTNANNNSNQNILNGGGGGNTQNSNINNSSGNNISQSSSNSSQNQQPQQ